MADADTETRRGWVEQGYDRHGVPRRLDIRVLDEWTTRGRRCVLLEVTRFFCRHASTRRTDTVLEEEETVYRGGVYVPELDAVLGGYSPVSPTQLEAGCDWKADWTWTAEADDLVKPGPGYDTLREAVREKTTLLAQGIAREHSEATGA